MQALVTNIVKGNRELSLETMMKLETGREQCYDICKSLERAIVNVFVISSAVIQVTV